MPETHVNDARRCLEAGALGIGEDHTKPDGRQLALDLIEAGVVTNLFVEFAETQFGPALNYARELADKGEGLDEVAKYAPNSNLFQCNIPLGKVIAAALLKKIPVHLADNSIMAARPSDFQRRHNTIREVFSRVTGQARTPPEAAGQSCVGCLLLWGGAHFEGSQALDNYILGLPFIKMG